MMKSECRNDEVKNGLLFIHHCGTLTSSLFFMATIAQAALYRLIGEANSRGERVVVASVADTRGSTPQRRGAKMLFFEDGEVAGTVGGGCIEAEVWAEAREALRSGKPALHKFSLTADEASEEGMVCGGTMEIFIDVWKPNGSDK
jgi:xanthine dehydrogenase accessory factor